MQSPTFISHCGILKPAPDAVRMGCFSKAELEEEDLGWWSYRDALSTYDYIIKSSAGRECSRIQSDSIKFEARVKWHIVHLRCVLECLRTCLLTYLSNVGCHLPSPHTPKDTKLPRCVLASPILSRMHLFGRLGCPTMHFTSLAESSPLILLLLPLLLLAVSVALVLWNSYSTSVILWPRGWIQPVTSFHAACESLKGIWLKYRTSLRQSATFPTIHVQLVIKKHWHPPAEVCPFHIKFQQGQFSFMSFYICTLLQLQLTLSGHS